MELQYLIYALELGAVYALFALGLSLAWGMLDVLNLAHGALFTLGGFVAFRLGELWVGAPFPALVLAAMVCAGAGAAVLEFVAYGQIRRRFKNRTQIELSTLAAAIGAAAVIDQLIGISFVGEVFPVATHSIETHVYRLGPISISNIQIMIVVVALVLAFVLDQWVQRSRSGLATRAVAEAPRRVSLFGVSVARVALGTMFVSGALAGLAGVLFGAASTGLSVETGHILLVKGFAVVVVGGVGSTRGTVLAAFLLGLSEVLIVALGAPHASDAIAFALILLFLIFRPQGLFSRKSAVRA